MLPWSVMAKAGWPSFTAAFTRSAIRAAPSSIENSVCVCRCVNEPEVTALPLPPGRLSTGGPGSVDRVTAVSFRVRPYSPGVTPGAPNGAPIPARRASEVGAGALPRGRRTRRQAPLADLLELGPRRHLLDDEGGLDPVEQALQPSDELGLGDPQLGLGRRRVGVESDGHAVELGHQVGGEPARELAQRLLVDLAEADPACLVQRGLTDLVEQLLDHRADPHDLGRLPDRLAGELVLEPAGRDHLVGRDRVERALLLRTVLRWHGPDDREWSRAGAEGSLRVGAARPRAAPASRPT